ncbi:DUF349 domain-containing protein [Flavobacterium crassostreae]|uniref:Chromosome segregation protein n=1 Tax=Flavobacterium crassostreae TaxID=1763534 RepID=A0A1B9E9Q2_9FLAO|nr:DUF349 domain-containing protein [Flavobacterium crassostreae]OCB78687.1 chromosome segregation protein [Flavobacterium crassostreae]
MLEEKNDNLQNADGKSALESLEKKQTTAPEKDATENTIAGISEQSLEQDSQRALRSIDASNAEESEDQTLKERHEIPMQDYDSLSMVDLVEALNIIAGSDKIMSVKEHVDEIKKSFLAKYTHFIEEKKEEFQAENPDSTEDFEYHLPLKAQFDALYTTFKNKKNTHFKSLQTNLKSNLENRLAIVEELKELINPQENIKDTLKHFNELRERWKNAGSIPKDKYNHVWNNYHFHVENFYDYLHLDREARDLDFKHNLEQKQKIVLRVQELLNEEDVNKAFRELQDLHRMWKEDIGPVSKEHREEIWNLFSDLTKKMHDKRELLFEKQRELELVNLENKKQIIAEIEDLATIKVHAHSQWLLQIEKVEALRTAFFAAGKVPSEVNEATWSSFKTAVRNFNSFKNSFYKEIKKDQNENLNKKNALVAKAQELQDNTDFEATTPIMKNIQEEWKKIGHVPRKFSDKVWTEFKAACNHYFDRLNEQKSENIAEEMESFDKKKTYLESLREFELSGDHKIDLEAIKQHIENWKNLGRVPHARRHIEGKFNKILDALFDKLSLSKKETDMMRFTNRLDNLAENNETRKLENEKIFLIRKIDEVQNEIFQLENNIQFFANTKNAKKENSIVLEVRKNIAIHKESLEVWKEKLNQLRSLNQE